MPVLTDDPVELRERRRGLASVDGGGARWWLPSAIAAVASEALEPVPEPEKGLGQ
jgi:hypothetical protein